MHLQSSIVVVAVVAAVLVGCAGDDAPEEPTAEATATPTAAATPTEAGGPDDEGGAPTPDEATDTDGEQASGLRVELEPAEGWHEADDAQLAELGGMGAAQVYTNDDACEDERCPLVYALVVSSPASDAQEYHELSRQEVEGRLDAEVVEEGEVEIDGHPGHELVYDIDTEDGTQHQVVRHTVVDGEAVVVAYMAEGTEQFEAWRADAEAMLESARVIDAE